jgi:HK97 family phage major capsid protein
MRTIKHIRQDIAENTAAQAALRKEGRALLAVAADARTEAQTIRITAAETELDALVSVAADLEREHVRALKFQDDERAQATVGRLEMGADLATARQWGPTLHTDATPAMRHDARLAALGEFGIAVYLASTGQGADPRLFAAATGMGTAIPSDGGFAVPQEVAPGIEREMYEAGDLLGRVDARTISGDSIAYNVIDETSRADGSRQGGVRHYWVDQGTAPTASATKLARVEMKLRKAGCLGYMTDELVADAAALGGELQAMFTEELVFGVEDAITEGNGAGQPLGYLNAPCLVSVSKDTGQAAATISHQNLVNMSARMRPRDFANAAWLANVDTKPKLHTLTMPAGTSALEPRFVTYGNDGRLTIFGLPVVFTEYNATLGTVGDIVLINLKKYRLIRKGGVEQASSIHVRFTQGEQTFRAFYRCDGQMMPRAALTPFKGTGNTLSPVVVLATRA